MSRSLLSVPASHWRMVEKAVASAADVVMLDLEDAVAPPEKVAARANVARALRDLDWGASRRAYRVNGLDTPFFYRDLIEVVEQAGERLDLVIVPKVGRPEDVYLVVTLLDQVEAAVGLPPGRVRVGAQIESTQGLTRVERIAAASPRLASLHFGPGDFAASAGLPMTGIGVDDGYDEQYSGHRLHYPMSRIVVAARAAGIQAIDGPYADFTDPDGFRRSGVRARALGYRGKWCIHPSQIALAREIFSPSAAELAWAEAVIAAYQAAASSGSGAARLGNQMIDAASLRLAREIQALSSINPSVGRRPDPR